MAAFGLGMKRLTHKRPSGVSETLRSQTFIMQLRHENDPTTNSKEKNMNAKTQNDEEKKKENVNNREFPLGSETRLRLVKTLNK